MFSSFIKSLTGGGSSSSSSTQRQTRTGTPPPPPQQQQESTTTNTQTVLHTIIEEITGQPPTFENKNNNNESLNNTQNKRNIPEELIEIDREWSAIKGYFDAAIIVEIDNGCSSEDERLRNEALSSQLSELDAKLKRIVALVYCGGRLPSVFAKKLQPGASVRWDKIPNPTNNRSQKALLRCREEGVQIFSVACQHAKLNLPPGSRSVLASFMLEMLAMMETSSSWIDTYQNNNNNRNVDDEDDNDNNHDKQTTTTSNNNINSRNKVIGDCLVQYRHGVCEPLVNFLAKTVNDVIRVVQLHHHHEEERYEKLYYAKLIRYLCESVAHQGDRLLSSSIVNNNNNATNTSTKALADSGQLSLPWLLDIVTMFSRADDLFPVAPLALDAALRGHLTLAVSAFDIVGDSNNNNNNNYSSSSSSSSTDFFEKTLLSHLGFTFVTLCRLEDNQEFPDHLSVIATTMKYLESICIFAPHVMDSCDLPAKFFKFLVGTVVEMVKLPSDRSFRVSMLLLSLMMESSSSVPGNSPLPTLIAQAVLCHSEDVAEAFFGRLRDISVDVRTAAGNFLISAMKCCPMLFVSLIHNGMKKSKPMMSSAAGSSSMFTISSDSISNIFPAITNMLIHDPGTIENCRINVEACKCKISYYETRGKESAPGLHLLPLSSNINNISTLSAYDANFLKLSAYFVKHVRTAISYDLQQFTTHDSTHCAVLSGILLEIMSLPNYYYPQQQEQQQHQQNNNNNNNNNTSPQHFAAFILHESIPSIAQHVSARLGRMDDRSRNVIEEIVQSATKKIDDDENNNSEQQQQKGDDNNNIPVVGAVSAEFALKSVAKRVPDEFKSFARGAVHLTQLRLELWSLLKAKEEHQRLREIDPDE